MSHYNCNNCAKSFSQKLLYDKHVKCETINDKTNIIKNIPLLKKEDNCKGKSFKITINNYTTENLYEFSLMVKKLNPYKWVYSQEVGKQGTPHIQGYLRFLKETRRSSITRMINKGFYCELSKFNKGSSHEEMDAEQWIYCVGLVEEKQMVYNQYSKHNYECYPEEPIEILEDDQLRPFQQSLEDILLGDVNKNKAIWVYDEQGHIGKTEMVRRWYIKYRVPFAYGGKSSDIVNLIFNNKNYFLTGKNRAMVYNFGRLTKNDKIPYNSMEMINDGCISNTKFKCFIINKPKIFVFANCLSKMSKLTSSKWLIKTIKNMELIDYQEDDNHKIITISVLK